MRKKEDAAINILLNRLNECNSLLKECIDIFQCKDQKQEDLKNKILIFLKHEKPRQEQKRS
jgi:hypothetical protein